MNRSAAHFACKPGSGVLISVLAAKWSSMSDCSQSSNLRLAPLVMPKQKSEHLTPPRFHGTLFSLRRLGQAIS